MQALDSEKMMEELAAAQSNKLKDFMKKDKGRFYNYFHNIEGAY